MLYYILHVNIRNIPNKIDCENKLMKNYLWDTTFSRI